MEDDNDFEDSLKAPPGFEYPVKKKKKDKKKTIVSFPSDEPVVIEDEEEDKKSKKSSKKDKAKKEEDEDKHHHKHHHHHHHKEEEEVDDVVEEIEDSDDEGKKPHKTRDDDVGEAKKKRKKKSSKVDTEEDMMDFEGEKKTAKKPKKKSVSLQPGQASLSSFFFPTTNASSAPKPDVIKPKESKKEEEKPVKSAPHKEAKKEEEKKEPAAVVVKEVTKPKVMTAKEPVVPVQEASKPKDTMEQKKKSAEVHPEKASKPLPKPSLPTQQSPMKRQPPTRTPEEEKETEEPEVKKKRFFYNGPIDRSALNPHSKPIPEGKMNCLAGKVFTITGRLDSLDREEATDLIKKYGGAVQQQAGVKVTHVLVGVDGGESKIRAARERNLKTLNEDELFEMIRTLPAQPSSAVIRSPTRKKSAAAARATDAAVPNSPVVLTQPKTGCVVVPVRTQPIVVGASGPKVVTGSTLSNPLNERVSKRKEIMEKANGTQMMWVDKYAPLEMQDMVLGNRNITDRLSQWLRSWKTPSHKGTPDKGGNRASAVLLSGPPGIGKTTSARVVCKELGFSVIELNASDTRSKNSLRDTVQEAMTSSSLSSYFMADGEKSESCGSVLVMDEVDGMSGGDRGGISELIGLIKSSPKIPIICICNDRGNQKIRTLATHCTDLRMMPPTPDQISPLLCAIAHAEGYGQDVINPEVARRIAVSADCDLRQCIHLLQMTCIGSRGVEGKPSATNGQPQKMKDLDLNPFEVIPKFFTYIGSSLDQKFRYCFSDYNLVPLLVSENYILTKPRLAGLPGKNSMTHMDLIAASADDISASDILEADIRRDSRWELLNEHMLLSCVEPCFRLQGGLLTRNGSANFPMWLGKYSSGAKNTRLVREVASHARAETSSAGSFDIVSDYMPLMFEKLTKPMSTQGAAGIEETLDFMNSYNLTREDWDTVTELCVTPMAPKRKLEIPSTVRAAFTRKYNAMNGTVLPGEKISKVSATRVTDSERQGVADFEFGREADPAESLEDDEDEDGEPKVTAPASKRKRSSSGKKDSPNTKPPKNKRRTSKE